MSLHIDMGWLIATLLVSVRAAAATVLAPVLGPTQVPGAARVAFAMALSALLVSAVPVPAVAIDSVGPLLIAVLGEAFLGFTFAFGFIAAYAATQLAGRALDMQIGFGAAAIINPATQTYAPLLGTLFGMLATAVFLSIDGHLVLLQALSASIEHAPPGSILADLDLHALLKHSAVTFTFALALAAPVMFMFLLADLAMAVLARSMPQLNVFVLGFAVKIMLGLLGLALSVRFAQALLHDLFGATFAYWERLSGAR